MSSPPQDRLEFWIRFVCGFVFFGLIAGFIVFQYLDALGTLPRLLVWSTVTLAVSVYVARVGDEAWFKLLDFFRG